MKALLKLYNDTSLIVRILIGMILGAILGLIAKDLTVVDLLGTLFVGALKAVAPLLVFVLVMSALAQGSQKMDSRFTTVIVLYMLSTLMAAVVAVAGSFLFPQTMVFAEQAVADSVPQTVSEVLLNVVKNMVTNPLKGIMDLRRHELFFSEHQIRAEETEGKLLRTSHRFGVGYGAPYLVDIPGSCL